MHRDHHRGSGGSGAGDVPRKPEDVGAGARHLSRWAHVHAPAHRRMVRNHPGDRVEIAVPNEEHEPQSGTMGDEPGQQRAHVASDAAQLAGQATGFDRHDHGWGRRRDAGRGRNSFGHGCVGMRSLRFHMCHCFTRSPRIASTIRGLRQLCQLASPMVGATGFEPATSCSRSRRATGLRYAPPNHTCTLKTSSMRPEELESPTF